MSRQNHARIGSPAQNPDWPTATGSASGHPAHAIESGGVLIDIRFADGDDLVLRHGDFLQEPPVGGGRGPCNTRSGSLCPAPRRTKQHCAVGVIGVQRERWRHLDHHLQGRSEGLRKPHHRSRRNGRGIRPDPASRGGTQEKRPSSGSNVLPGARCHGCRVTVCQGTSRSATIRVRVS
jgi:hypothetical protein